MEPSSPVLDFEVARTLQIARMRLCRHWHRGLGKGENEEVALRMLPPILGRSARSHRAAAIPARRQPPR